LPEGAVAYRSIPQIREEPNFRRATGSMTVRDWRTCIDDVLEGRSDIAVTDVPSADVHPELTAERLGERPAAFFCHRSHPLFDKRGCTWDDVMRYPWALTRTQSRWLHLLPPDLGSAGRVDPETGDFVPAICVDSFAAMTAAVRNGRAISVASPGFIRSELERREFRLLDLDEPRMRISYGVIRRRDAVVGKALAAFIETLREAELACREAEREPAAFEWEPRPHRAVALTPAPRALVTTGPPGPPAR
jgi:DNA-binding transcriptional LysR family regulator